MNRIFSIMLGFAATVSPLRADTWTITGSTGAHDPTIIKDGGMWYCFTTGNGVATKSSADGRQWTTTTRLFDSELSWWRTYAPRMGQNDVWAPVLQRFGDRVWCYYAVSEFGQNNSAIGLKSCTSIATGDWRDDGFVIGSRAGDIYNAIDPHLSVDAEGNPWLAFGSWFAGIYIVRLDPATMKPAGTMKNIAQRAGGIEGANVIYANGYYYLFVSIDNCCQGVNSTYKIAVGRSRSITGPYVDKNNAAMLNGGGSLFEVSNGRFIGPGGQDVYRDGNAWMIARHFYDGNANGRATLEISDLYWDVAGWPSFTAPAIDPPTAAPAASGGDALAVGASVTLTADGSDASAVWLKDGLAIAGASGGTYSLNNFQPQDSALYATLTNQRVSAPAVLGVMSNLKTLGAAAEIGTDIVHQNKNVYDQVLLQGAVATITADPGQVTRISYVDRNDDIVQVEFSGAGSLTLALEPASGPMAPANYNQPDVAYMKGHARIVIAGANETTNVSIFSVGRATAVNQALFRSDVVYDGWADLASLAIRTTNGRFGGVRTANARFSAVNGVAGVYAPGVQFDGPLYVGNINANDAATPMLVIGAVTDAKLTGGDLRQDNGRPIVVAGLDRLQFTAGTSSHGELAPARANQGRLQRDGVDVTDQIVVNP